MLANLASRDIRSNKGANIRVVEDASGLSVWNCCQVKLREAIRVQEKAQVEESDKWRIPYLNKLLCQRQELDYLGLEEEKTRVEELINSLCIH